jgi:GAF domain-containing protein
MTLQADLIRVVQRLSFCRDMESVMAVLRESARELTGADGVTIVLRDGDLCHYVEENAIEPLWKGRKFPLETCISGWCMLHRKQTVVPDIYADARIPHEAYRPTFVRSLAMTPIRQEEPIGAIGAYWADTHLASPEELTILQALGDSAAMAIANVQMIQRLQEANRHKDRFLAMLAHELRNPLAPIRNGLHVLRLHAGDDTDDLAARTRALMDRQIQLLSRIVDDLLDAARITGGQVTLRRERVDLTSLVRVTRGSRSATLGLRSATRGSRSAIRGLRDPTRGLRSVARGSRSATRGLRSATRGSRSATRGLRSATRGLRSAIRGLRSAIRGLRVPIRGLRSATRGSKSPTRG